MLGWISKLRVESWQLRFGGRVDGYDIHLDGIYTYTSTSPRGVLQHKKSLDTRDLELNSVI